jgi:hypothetical protein
VREGKDLKRSYLSSISAKFNPDLLIGHAFEEDDDSNDHNTYSVNKNSSLDKIFKR